MCKCVSLFPPKLVQYLRSGKGGPVLRAVEADDLPGLVVDLRLRGNARNAHPADLASRHNYRVKITLE